MRHRAFRCRSPRRAAAPCRYTSPARGTVRARLGAEDARQRRRARRLPARCRSRSVNLGERSLHSQRRSRAASACRLRGMASTALTIRFVTPRESHSKNHDDGGCPPARLAELRCRAAAISPKGRAWSPRPAARFMQLHRCGDSSTRACDSTPDARDRRRTSDGTSNDFR